MRQALHIIILSICLLTVSRADAGGAEGLNCPVVRIDAERLPDMTVPRSGHSAFFLNGELTVVGGHTSGFVLTPTAEYFKDGEWHLLPTVYSHDGGISTVMKSGKVLLAGGFKDNLGIGQSFEVEFYDPATHQSKGFSCLDQKRASGAALELDSGRVMIVGNWYADDGIEMFDGKTSFSHVRGVSQSRSLPHVFRTSDDAMIVAGYDFHGEPIDSIIIDRLYGEPFRSELFDTWKPLHYDLVQHSGDSFIGDETKGEFRYLMPVKNEMGQLAIVEVRDTVFSPLSISGPVPMKSQWGAINYITPVYADRKHKKGYVVGFDDTNRLYALCIDYSRLPAPLTLYHTDPLPETGMQTIPVLTPEGNLILTGGVYHEANSNFSPLASVWLLRLNGEESSGFAAGTKGWLWWALAAILIAAIVAFVMKFRKPRPQPTTEDVLEPLPQKENTLLMQRICELMDERQLYLQQSLKVSDIASMLGTNSRYVSDCIKSNRGYSISQFVNGYRIEHSKRLMMEHPEMKLSTVAVESGFSNDKALGRCFKEFTGLTPTEWKNKNLK